MKLLVPEDIESYARDHTRSRGPLFDELREYTYRHMPSPQMQVGRIEGTLLMLLAKLIGARRVLEIGTFTGYSTLCLAEALPDDGEVITCDVSEEFTSVARAFFDKSPHGEKITVILGDGLTTVQNLEPIPFDMAFVDADKARYPAYYDAIIPRLRPGGLFVADNTLWNGDVLAPESEDARGIAAFNDRVQNDDRVENVLLTVRDGVMLARKR